MYNIKEKEKDKFAAIWISHSSISDFLKCPRSYFLKNIYKKQGDVSRNEAKFAAR